MSAVPADAAHLTLFCLHLWSLRAEASTFGMAPHSQGPNDHLYQLGFVPGGL